MLLSSGRPHIQVAKEPGVCTASLAHCRNAILRNEQSLQDSLPKTKGLTAAPGTDPVTEIRRLQHGVEYLRRQREKLKKAMSILFEDRESQTLTSSTSEQTKIANLLTALDRKIESVAAQISHTQTFKKGQFQQMFV